MRHLLPLVALLAGCPGASAPVSDAGSPDTTQRDSGNADAGPRCPSCPGSVVAATRGALGFPGFSVACPDGEVVDFAGTTAWTGPGLDLATHACAEEAPPGGGESSFYVCCEPAPDAGVADAGTPDSGSSTDGGLP